MRCPSLPCAKGGGPLAVEGLSPPPPTRKKRECLRRRSIGIYPVLLTSFSPQASHSSLKDTKYSCVLMEHLQEKTSRAKLHSTSKRRVFLQEQAKSHGNADAYRGFLTHYWWKTPFLKRVTPLWSAAFRLALFLSCNKPLQFCNMSTCRL